MLVSATAAPFVKFRSQQPDNNLSRRSCRTWWGGGEGARCDDGCGYQRLMYTSMSKLIICPPTKKMLCCLESRISGLWSRVWPRGGVEAGSGDHSSGSGWRREYSQPGMDITSRNHLLFSHCKPSFFLRPQIKDLKLKPHFHSKSPCIIFFLRMTDHPCVCSSAATVCIFVCQRPSSSS